MRLFLRKPDNLPKPMVAFPRARDFLAFAHACCLALRTFRVVVPRRFQGCAACCRLLPKVSYETNSWGSGAHHLSRFSPTLLSLFPPMMSRSFRSHGEAEDFVSIGFSVFTYFLKIKSFLKQSRGQVSNNPLRFVFIM